jgi:hypothetical protein
MRIKIITSILLLSLLINIYSWFNYTSNEIDKYPKIINVYHKTLLSNIDELMMIIKSFGKFKDLLCNVFIEFIYLIIDSLRVPFIIIKLLYNLGLFNLILNLILIPIKSIPYLYLIKVKFSFIYLITNKCFIIIFEILSILNPFYLINIFTIEIFYLIFTTEILFIFLMGKFILRKVKLFYEIESITCAICIEDILGKDLINPILYKNIKEILISQRPDINIINNSRCFIESEGLITKLNCGHYYHGKCFEEFIKNECRILQSKIKCPICRVEAS